MIIKSGRMDGIYAHNSANVRNAYSTLLSALLYCNDVQIDGLPNCSSTQSIPLNLWTGSVGLIGKSTTEKTATSIDGGTALSPVSEEAPQ
jgi:hypothetical protein